MVRQIGIGREIWCGGEKRVCGSYIRMHGFVGMPVPVAGLADFPSRVRSGRRGVFSQALARCSLASWQLQAQFKTRSFIPLKC